jgi:hypothetical protein
MLSCGAASANGAGYSYGQEGEAVIDPKPGDPIWWPTTEQLQRWVNWGIDAAAKGTGLLDAASVEYYVRAFPQGIPCHAGELRFVVMVSPQLVSTTAGWSAAWEEDLWQQIQTDQDTVSGTIASALSEDTARSELRFLFGIARDDVKAPVDANAAMWVYGEWHHVHLSLGGTAAERADDAPAPSHPTERWAGSYVMAWMMYDTALSDPGRISVVEGQFLRRQRIGPDAELTDAAQVTPRATRLVIGRPEEYAYVDF